MLIDLPGTYSLAAQSEEEQITAEFLQSGEADCIVVVVDATCLERNLRFALQVIDQMHNVIVCVNLLDEASKHEILIDLNKLQKCLSVPVVGTTASIGNGLLELKDLIRNTVDGFVSSKSDEIEDHLERSGRDYSQEATKIYEICVQGKKERELHWFDHIALGKWSGRLLLLGILFLIFWVTIVGANYPSSWLQNIFDRIYRLIIEHSEFLPRWLVGIFMDGVYATTAKVISVMLPPLLIFFPLFTLLEDLGYLTRAAFLTDRSFERCGSCGKQLLTMSMGFGCNAIVVMSCRIISSKAERLMSMITNAFVPCNGRFPTLIVLSTLFFSNKPLLASTIIMAVVILGILMTLLTTKIMSITAFKDTRSGFIMEMPPYRRPNIKKIFTYAIMNKALYVLLRAVSVAAPMGALMWILQHINICDTKFVLYLAQKLDPVGLLLGMNGAILLAFILSFPANELLLPTLVVIMNSNAIISGPIPSLSTLLISNGWTWKTALCTMIFTVFHWPCSTTCLTIRKESGSWKWVLISAILPAAIGTILCVLLNQCVR